MQPQINSVAMYEEQLTQKSQPTNFLLFKIAKLLQNIHIMMDSY